MHKAKSVLQAPTKQLAIARRHQKSAAGECRCGADQRLQAGVALGNGMTEKGDIRAIGSGLAEVFDYPRRPLLNRIRELAAAMMPVHPLAQGVTGRQIGFRSWPHLVARKADAQRLAVEL